MEKTNLVFNKIQHKGNCYIVIQAVILPVKDRTVIINVPGKEDICHPVARVIHHHMVNEQKRVLCQKREMTTLEDEEI